MTFSIHGIAVSRGIAIGRAVIMASGRVDVAHYFIDAGQVDAEIARVRAGRNAVVEEIQRLQQTISQMGPKEAPHELTALLDVHLMLLQDEELISGVKHWITDRLYNAEWALTTQLEVLSRQFDDMEDDYLRERKADLEQVAERILRYMKGVDSPVSHPPAPKRKTSQDLLLDDSIDVPLLEAVLGEDDGRGVDDHHAGRHPGRPEGGAARQHRAARGRACGAAGGRGGRRPVPQ
jgi:phosphoenolpyruvate-protein phosphotransferase (PTS system enzyme I)